jgi:hypothetical protein
MSESGADAAGVRKAPRHEIAVEHVTAVPRTLWGFGRRGWLNEFGLKRLVRSFLPMSTAIGVPAVRCGATFSV